MNTICKQTCLFCHVCHYWCLNICHFVQDECSLEPELYERAEKLFRELLPYVTDMLLWKENSDLPPELHPRYVLENFTPSYINFKPPRLH